MLQLSSSASCMNTGVFNVSNRMIDFEPLRCPSAVLCTHIFAKHIYGLSIVNSDSIDVNLMCSVYTMKTNDIAKTWKTALGDNCFDKSSCFPVAWVSRMSFRFLSFGRQWYLQSSHHDAVLGSDFSAIFTKNVFTGVKYSMSGGGIVNRDPFTMKHAVGYMTQIGQLHACCSYITLRWKILNSSNAADLWICHVLSLGTQNCSLFVSISCAEKKINLKNRDFSAASVFRVMIRDWFPWEMMTKNVSW